ncbi:MAG: hypothetical protein JO072_10130 [Parafilimonas sp.]|nr:hypothetical protein [Parafilimonas sp.]
MKLKLSKLIPAGALLCLVLASCKKNEAVTSPSSSTGSSLAKTTSMIGAMVGENDIEIADALSSNDKTDNSSSCKVVTYNPSENVYPHTKIVDYGSGCTDDQGITRSGKRFSTVYADQETAPAGKVVSVTTFSNYYVNGVSISGNVKVTVITPASSGALTLRVVVNKTVTDSLGNTSSFVNTAIQKQVGGTVDDRIFQIDENAYGTEVSGDSAMVTWKAVTDPSNPIMKMASCEFRSQGALMISLKENGVQTNEYLDYGNGNCDNMATLKVGNDDPQNITLPFYFFDGGL